MSNAIFENPRSSLGLPSSARKTKGCLYLPGSYLAEVEDSADSLIVVVHLQDIDKEESFPARSITLRDPTWSVQIGRGSTTDETIVPSSSNGWFTSRVMSRHHAVIRADPIDRLVTIEENGSMHGTRLDGSKLLKGKREALCQQDMIQFGQEVVRGHEKYRPLRIKVSYEWSSSIDNREPQKVSFTNKFTADYSEEEDLGSGDDIQELEKTAFLTTSSTHEPPPASSPTLTLQSPSHGRNKQPLIDIEGEDDVSRESSVRSTSCASDGPLSASDLSDGIVVPDTQVELPQNTTTKILSTQVENDCHNSEHSDIAGYAYSDDEDDEDDDHDSLIDDEEDPVDQIKPIRDPSPSDAALVKGSSSTNSVAASNLLHGNVDTELTNSSSGQSKTTPPQLNLSSPSIPFQYGLSPAQFTGYPTPGAVTSCNQRPQTSYGMTNAPFGYLRSFAPAISQDIASGYAPSYPTFSYQPVHPTYDTFIPRVETFGINPNLNDVRIEPMSRNMNDRWLYSYSPTCSSDEESTKYEEHMPQHSSAFLKKDSYAPQPPKSQQDLPSALKPSEVVTIDVPKLHRKRTFDEFNTSQPATSDSASAGQAEFTAIHSSCNVGGNLLSSSAGLIEAVPPNAFDIDPSASLSSFSPVSSISERAPSLHYGTKDGTISTRAPVVTSIKESEGPMVKRRKIQSKVAQPGSGSALTSLAKYTATAALGMAVGALGTIYGLAALPLDYFD